MFNSHYAFSPSWVVAWLMSLLLWGLLYLHGTCLHVTLFSCLHSYWVSAGPFATADAAWCLGLLILTFIAPELTLNV